MHCSCKTEYASTVSNALSDTSEVRASIFEHPLFERLEMETGEDIT